MILFVLEALTALVLILLLIWWTIAGGRKHKDADPADPQFARQAKQGKAGRNDA